MKNFVCLSKFGSARTTQGSCAGPAYLIAILLAVVSFVAPAQSRPLDSPAGSVHGTVRVISPDGRSHVASGAQIRLIGATRDASQLAVTDDSGQYKFEGVRPGSYQLEVALGSFEKVAKPITIRAGETTVEDVKLELKGARDEVIVKAERVGLNLRDAGPATDSQTDPANERLREAALNVKGSLAGNGKLMVNRSVASYDPFNPHSDRHFLSAPNQTVGVPKFSSPEMQVLKTYVLKVSPRISLGNQHHGRLPQFPDVQGSYPREFQGHLANSSFGVMSNGVGRVFGMRFVIEKK